MTGPGLVHDVPSNVLVRPYKSTAAQNVVVGQEIARPVKSGASGTGALHVPAACATPVSTVKKSATNSRSRPIVVRVIAAWAPPKVEGSLAFRE